MKRIALLLTLVLACALIFCGCGKEDTPYDYDLKEYVALGDFPGVEFDGDELQERMDEAIEEIASKFKTTTIVDNRPVEDGDIVTIDYVGKVDGKEFEGGSDEDTDLEIGSNTFIAGFEKGLIGKKIGEEVELNLVFPEDYKSADLAGKDVVFTVKIDGIKTYTFPTLTDDMVKEHTEYDKVSDFYENKSKELAETILWENYLKSCKVNKYPQKEVKVYYDNLVASYSQMAVYNGMTLESMVTSYYGYSTLDDFLSYVMNTAMASVKEEMVIYLTAREQKFTVTDEEYKKLGEDQAKENGYQSLEDYEAYMSKDGIKLGIYKDKIVEKAYGANTIKYEGPVAEETAEIEETKGEETKPEETKAEETKAEETKPEETKAAETEAVTTA